MAPDFLVIGHIVKDINEDGWRPGGSVLYAAAQARRLGRQVAAVTACGPDVNPSSILPDVEWRVVRAGTTTSFENRYIAGRREQRVVPGGAPLAFSDIPEEWLTSSVILLAPVFHDVDPGCPRLLHSHGCLLGISAQGWLRREANSRVSPGEFVEEPPWLEGDVLFISEEDVASPESSAAWQQHGPLVVLTRGAGGCTLWDNSGRHGVPAFAVDEADPTGAGDVFAAAFLVRLHETLDPVEAARFASAAAALSVRGSAVEAIASRAEIEAMLRAHSFTGGVRA